MSTFSFGGIATGLDTGAIVAQLVAIKRQPIVRLEQRKTLFEKIVSHPWNWITEIFGSWRWISKANRFLKEMVVSVFSFAVDDSLTL